MAIQVSIRDLKEYPVLKEYIILSGEMDERKKQRNDIKDEAFTQYKQLLKDRDIKENENVTTKAGRFSALIKYNVFTSKWHLPNYLQEPYDKLTKRIKDWKSSNPNKCESGEGIRVSINS